MVVGRLAAGEEVGDEGLTAGWGADQVDCLGAEERGGEVRGVEALLWGGVAEGAVFGCGVAVPAAGGQAGGVVAEEGRGLPGVDLGGDGGGEVGALVDYPADCLGGRGPRGEEAGTEG